MGIPRDEGEGESVREKWQRWWWLLRIAAVNVLMIQCWSPNLNMGCSCTRAPNSRRNHPCTPVNGSANWRARYRGSPLNAKTNNNNNDGPTVKEKSSSV